MLDGPQVSGGVRFAYVFQHEEDSWQVCKGLHERPSATTVFSIATEHTMVACMRYTGQSVHEKCPKVEAVLSAAFVDAFPDG